VRLRRWKPWLVLTLSLVAAPALAAEYPLGLGQAAVGAPGVYVTHPGDVLLDVARAYDLGFTQLMAANRGVDPWLPRPGTRITLPTRYILPDARREGIVVNLAEWRLFYLPPGGGRVETYPIGIGVIGDTTPLGATSVVWKEANPTWFPPASIRATAPDLPAAIPPGPDDPLGAFALHLGWTDYLIHGTNKPDGVGRNVSHGCIRLYAQDIERLFHEARVGTPVRVVRQAVEAAWIGNALFVEVHPSKAQGDEIDTSAAFTPEIPDELFTRVRAAAGDHVDLVDWAAVRQAGLQRTGAPMEVARLPVSEATKGRGNPQFSDGSASRASGTP
jgi:L,D-transpeptidase ErfK/SrfK